MKTWIRAMVSTAIAGIVVFAPSGAQADEKSPQPEYLYVFDGRGGKMTPVAGKPGTFDFTMPIGVGDRVVTWFTDRPDRNAGHMSMKSFVEWWASDGPDSFKVNPPNVAISSGRRTMIATMSNASLGPSTSGGDELRATMTAVPSDAVKEMAASDSVIAQRIKDAGTLVRRGSWLLPTVSVFVDLTMNKSASQH